jgi:hypothetical protein
LHVVSVILIWWLFLLHVCIHPQYNIGLDCCGIQTVKGRSPAVETPDVESRGLFPCIALTIILHTSPQSP